MSIQDEIKNDVKFVETKLSYWFGILHAELLNLKDHLIMGDHQKGLTHLNKTLDFIDKNVVPEIHKTTPEANPPVIPTPEPAPASLAVEPSKDITL